MQQLVEISNRLINSTSLAFKRSLFDEIQWENRLIEIRGPRGVGKTTLMLQQAKALMKKNNVLYISLDNAYFFQNKLIDLADEFFKYGGTHLFIDEVHKYPPKQRGLDWSQEIKNIYDSYPDLYVVYSGSSILQLYKGIGDLSRRKISYRLVGLSFREFLVYSKLETLTKLSLPDIFQHHRELASDIINRVKILPLFREYLRFGYYPFFKESKNTYFERLNEIINVIMETDIPAVSEINFDATIKLKKLFSLLATSVPYAPNISKLSGQLGIADSRTLLKYLNYIEKAELIKTLNANALGNQILNKPDKIYLDNTNLMYCISQDNINDGTLRETFLISQLKYHHSITYPKQGDILINGEYTLEVGGKNKTSRQIAEIKNSFVAKDNIESGFGQNIPLWLFGFLY